MPYISQEARRKAIMKRTTELTSGELNFTITEFLLSAEPKTYEDYNRLIGVLECIKLEFYRRAVAVYEDRKKEENGDVY